MQLKLNHGVKITYVDLQKIAFYKRWVKFDEAENMT